MYKFLSVAGLFLASLLLSDLTQAKSIDSIFEHAQYSDAKISPDGKYIAVSVLLNGKQALAFLDRETKKTVGSASFNGREEVLAYHWINAERVVIKIGRKVAYREAPLFYGELYAVNFDGTKGKMIYGMRAGEMQTGSRIKKKESTVGWGDIIDILPEENDHILISSTPINVSREGTTKALKLNAYTGIVKKEMARSPISRGRFITDVSGEIKASVGTNTKDEAELYINKEGEWELVPSSKIGLDIQPISFSASGKYLYVFDDYTEDKTGLYKLNIEDFSYKKVFSDKKIDVTHVELTEDGRTAYAIKIDDGYPAYLILNKSIPEGAAFKELLGAFPYSSVNITSKTDDGKQMLVAVHSDVNPGTIYIYDFEAKKLEFLYQYHSEFQAKEFAQMEPIKFQSSDGLEINGYFTSAKPSEKAKIAPTVVLVHGGPHGVRDLWQFSNQIQYLVKNGFSVLQINYRGSGGYGTQFEYAGHKVWGTKIQQDIYEGLQWLIGQNKASEGNSCIMGASFGAYSAIQSAIQYPNTYKCAVANAGIYDLELMFESGDIPKRMQGKSFLKRVLGTDKAALRAMSPVNHVDKIQIPILLAHGEDDYRAPVEHVENLRDALDKSKKDYEWYVVDGEGHGFYNPKTQRAYMKNVVDFLSSHLEM